MAKKFCKLLDKAIKDEMGAPKNYYKLKKASLEIMPLKSGEWGTIHPIDKIILDEKEHARILEKIRRDFCE